MSPADAVLVVDGVFLQRPELAGCWDPTIFVDADRDAARERALDHDAGSTIDRVALARRFAQRYEPGQQLYFDEVRPAKRADIVIRV